MPEKQSRKAREGTDGRTRRAEENRHKVACAMLELVREGVAQPTREQVAERAQLSLRSVYHHFNNLEDLYEESCRIQFRSIRHLTHDLPQPADSSLPARIDAFIAQRAELYERITPVRRSAMLWIHRSPALAVGIAGLSEAMREQLVGTFREELGDHPCNEAGSLLDALEAATSWEAWEFMRHRKGFPPERAETALRTTLLRGLTPVRG